MTAHSHHRISRSLQSCGNCDAFVAHKGLSPKSGEPREGSCCAESPRLMQGMAPVPGSQLRPQGPQMAPQIMGVWPPTAADRWCRAWHETGDYDGTE